MVYAEYHTARRYFVFRSMFPSFRHPGEWETESLKCLAYTQINSPLNVDSQKWQVSEHKGTGLLFIFIL